MGFCPQLGGAGLCPPSAFGRAAASPQTRQMRCWPPPTEVIKAPVKGNPCAYLEQHPSQRNFLFTAEKQDVSPSGFKGFFSLHTVLFWHFCMGVVSLPSARVSCRQNAGRPRVTVACLPFLCHCGVRPAWAEYPLVGYTRHHIPEPRTQRLTRRNTGRFPRLRHRQGR